MERKIIQTNKKITISGGGQQGSDVVCLLDNSKVSVPVRKYMFGREQFWVPKTCKMRED